MLLRRLRQHKWLIGRWTPYEASRTESTIWNKIHITLTKVEKSRRFGSHTPELFASMHNPHNASTKIANRYSTVIFDLGDVLFTWSPSTPKSPLPAKTLREILRSVHWFEYEKGNLTEERAYSLVAQEFNLSAEDVKQAFQAARDSLQSNPQLLQLIRELREGGIAIYAMSNISAPDWDVLSTKASPEEWALFDHAFTSQVQPSNSGRRVANTNYSQCVCSWA